MRGFFVARIAASARRLGQRVLGQLGEQREDFLARLRADGHGEHVPGPGALPA